MSVKIDLTQVGAFRFILPEFRHDLSQISKILEKKQGEVLLMHGEPVAGFILWPRAKWESMHQVFLPPF